MPSILYLDVIPGDPIQATTLAGIRRYAEARGWSAESVAVDDSRPDCLKALLRRCASVAGCVVECSDGRTDLPPRLFGKVPVVYLHCPPSAYGGRAPRVVSDNAAIAAAAFRELSLGRPAAYGLVGFRAVRTWSRTREEAFRVLALAAGTPCHAFRRIWGYGGHYDMNREKRLARWLAALPRHTAVFAANDATAAEVVAAAHAAGRDIPHDLTLLGVDDNRAICEVASPSISSIRMDYERTGFLAAKMIGMRIGKTATQKADHPNCPSRLRCPGSISIMPLLAVRRESTRGWGRREPYVLQAVDIIRKEACEGLTVADLAERLPGTRRLLEMRFREAMGHSIMAEIMHVRLEKVETLLAGTDTAIGAIADFCGFGSDVELRQVFRARTGMSMREWRKLHR